MEVVQAIRTLDELWEYVFEMNKHLTSSLLPICGAGAEKPKFMFVFINPTVRNISSSPSWTGPRYPFIGTKQLWKVLHQAGLFDDVLMPPIENNLWTPAFARTVLEFLKSRSYYLTNLVKSTGSDARLPDKKTVALFLPILKREIELVQPEYIITCGLLPFEKLAKQKIKLCEYHAELKKTQRVRWFDVGGEKIIPCYFPVGRGNPKRAADILKLVAQF